MPACPLNSVLNPVSLDRPQIRCWRGLRMSPSMIRVFLPASAKATAKKEDMTLLPSMDEVLETTRDFGGVPALDRLMEARTIRRGSMVTDLGSEITSNKELEALLLRPFRWNRELS